MKTSAGNSKRKWITEQTYQKGEVVFVEFKNNVVSYFESVVSKPVLHRGKASVVLCLVMSFEYTLRRFQNGLYLSKMNFQDCVLLTLPGVVALP